MEIAGFILLFLLAAIIGFYIEMKSNSEINGAAVGALILVLTLFAFAMGNEYDETNIETQNIKQYTYRCKLCDEIVKAKEEPKVKLCDECMAIIKETESEDK